MSWERGALACLLATCACACSLASHLNGLSGGGDETSNASTSPADETAAAAPAEQATPATNESDAGSTDATSAFGTNIVVLGGENGNGGYSNAVNVARVNDDGSLTWQAHDPMPEGRLRAPVAVVGSKMIMPGGDALSSIRNDCIVGSLTGIELGALERTANGMPAGRFRHGTIAFGDRVYVVGGQSSTTAERTVWTASVAGGPLGGFAATTSLPEGRSAPVVVASGPHVYVVSGQRAVDGGGYAMTGDGWTTDIAADGGLGAWRSIPALPGLVTASAMGVATDSHVYVSGGYANTALYDFVVIAAIAADGSLSSWTAGPKLLTGRAGGAMVVAGNRIYVLGGMSAANLMQSTVEVADINADGSLSPWRLTTPLPAPVAFHSAAVVTNVAP